MCDPPIDSCANCPCGPAECCPLVAEPRAAGERLCTEGERGDTVWFVKRGAVMLWRGDRPRALRGPGSFVGLETLVGDRHADTARITQPTVLCTAPRETIDRWLGPRTAPARIALEQVLHATRRDVARAASADGTATRRVARCLLADDAPPELPRQVLASMLGMVPETLSRALARLRDAGAIALTRRSVTITDPVRLARLAL